MDSSGRQVTGSGQHFVNTEGLTPDIANKSLYNNCIIIFDRYAYTE